MANLEGTRVLVIDDSPDMRHLMSGWIASTGATVFEAEGGEQGLHLARSKRPHVIFCDLKMPMVDGFGFMEMLTHDHELCRTPVLVVSGEIGDVAIRQTWEAGFAGHLVKPVTKAAVLAQLERVFWSHR